MSHLFFDSETKKHKSFEMAGARPHYNPDRPGQVEHIFLDLTLDILGQSFGGTCQIRLNPVRSGIKTLVLDAVDLQIEGVKVGRAKQPFEYDGEQLQIHLKQPTTAGKVFTVAIAYAVHQPQRGLYFVQADEHYPDKPTQVWTQGEDEDSRFWFPCFDYPGQLATSEIRVRVPKAYMAISNGELIETEVDGKQKIYHWLQREVHPTYLMTLAVGQFAEIIDEWQGKPVTYYVEKGREDQAQLTMGKTPRMIEFFSEYYGYPYAYPKYAQVCVDDFIFGGMENTSTTLLTDRCLLDERAAIDNRAAESLVAHELAHQWFGDLVVIKHWSHAWIKEGMASYSEVMWTNHEYGAEDAAYYRLKEARNYFNEDSTRYRRPVVTHVYREAIELYDRHLYEKGACIYHMIRAELGDELFWRAIHTFVQDNAHQTVETIDLLRAIEKATGRNLLFLFDQYVYRGGHPEYKLGYSWDADYKMAKVTVTQTQVDPKDKHSAKELFDLNLPIAFGYDRGKQPVEFQTFMVRVHEQEQSFYFGLSEKPLFISFDQGNHYLKQVSLEYPMPELKAQLKQDPDPLSRIYAAQSLAKKGGLEVVKSLGEALTTDGFWGVRVEVAKQLAQIKLDQVLPALKPGLKDKDARVRRAVVEAMATFKTDESYKAIKPLAEKGDPSYYVEASALRAVGAIAASTLTTKPKETKVIKLFKSVLKDRAGWNEVVRSGAIGALSQMKTSTAALDLILAYTEAGTPQPLRLAAIRALGSISTGQSPEQLQRILDRLSVLVGESFFLTQVSVSASLGQMETPKAIALLKTLANQTPDGRVRRMAEESIKKVQARVKSNQALSTLQEEVQQLQQANQELKSRLADLEAKSKPSET
ncbi:M1 family metallopeptidase [Acaryochloris sp. CCMEE 5410]|uniref:M1 family metallopeptidase n=1 Tax=Acaryochloris sp. CCMEE 5410 TaxID=310037 RepID=UPI0002484145|nr:M1 family metallopeptidase [Acaryochloris sp. CCMEE 5410]KAI9133900.1 M1 family metallopeptidase [Acaryochloris sp. CCMEE 5410]